MYHWFGSQAYDVLNYNAVIGLPDFIGKSLRYLLANEMITNPIDFLIHRTQVAYFTVDNSIDYLQSVYDFLRQQGLHQDPIEVYMSHLNSLKEFKK